MVHFPLWPESSPHCKCGNANKFCIFAMQIYCTRCCKHHHMGPTHCNFRKHWTCETHWKTAQKALDVAVEFYVEGSSFTASAPFGNTSSVACYSAVPAIICSALHITSYYCYTYVSCMLCSLLVSSEVAASRGHVVVFALPFIFYLYHWFLFALLCLHCGERSRPPFSDDKAH